MQASPRGVSGTASLGDGISHCMPIKTYEGTYKCHQMQSYSIVKVLNLTASIVKQKSANQTLISRKQIMQKDNNIMPKCKMFILDKSIYFQSHNIPVFLSEGEQEQSPET